MNNQNNANNANPVVNPALPVPNGRRRRRNVRRGNNAPQQAQNGGNPGPVNPGVPAPQAIPNANVQGQLAPAANPPDAAPALVPPPNPAPMVVVQQVPRLYAHATAWAVASKVPVPLNYPQVSACLTAQGFHVRNTEPTTYGHPLSHVSRYAALQQLIIMEGGYANYERGVPKDLHILSYYGSDRDHSFNSDRGDHGDFEVKITCAPNDYAQGDLARNNSKRVALQNDMLFTHLYICDVYADGRQGAALTPQRVADLLAKTSSGVGYICWRPFVGYAGGDLVTKYGGPIEGMWVRRDGLIHFSPQEGVAPYPGHPDINWLFQKRMPIANGHLDISELKDIGPYKFSKVAIGAPDAFPVADVELPAPLVEKLHITTDSLGWILKKIERFPGLVKMCNVFQSFGMTERTCLTFMPIYTRNFLKFHTRLPSGITLDSLIAAVNNELETNSFLLALSQRFPAEYRRIALDSVVATQYSNRTDTVTRLARMRKMHAHLEPHLVNTRNRDVMPVEESHSWKHMVMYGVAVLTFAGGLYYYMNHRKVPTIPQRSIQLYSPKEANILQIVTSALLKRVKIRHIITLGAVLAGSDNQPVPLDEPIPSRRVTDYLARVTTKVVRKVNWVCAAVGVISAVWLSIPLLRTRSPQNASWKEYILARATDDQYNAKGVVHLPTGTTLFGTPVVAPLPLQGYRGTITMKWNGFPTSIGDVLCRTDPREGEHRATIYPILYTNAGLHRPLRNVHSLIAGLLLRTHNWPAAWLKPNNSAKFRHDRWDKLIDEIVHLFEPIGDVTLLTLQEAAESMGVPSKVTRMLRALKDYNLGYLRNRKKAMVKYDETIKRGADMMGVYKYKPRIIMNLDSTMQAWINDWTRYMSDMLHVLFNGNRVLMLRNKIRIRIIYASGLTADLLDRIATVIIDDPDSIIIVVAGDDGMIIWRGKIFHFDISAFDHSQDEGPLVIGAPRIMSKLGASRETIDGILLGFTLPYWVEVDIDKYNRLIIEGDPGVQMASGSAATTIVNSWTNIAMCTYMVLRHDTLGKQEVPTATEIAAYAEELGFELKVELAGTLQGAVFLRGWWVPDVQGIHRWTPLPSQVLKLGKILKDPRTASKESDPVMAVQRVAFALSTSVKVDTSYPILGKFLATLRRLSGPKRVTESFKEAVDESHYNRIYRAEVHTLNRRVALEMIEDRYNITVDEILEFEALCDTVSSLPAFVSHPLLLKLRDVDYA